MNDQHECAIESAENRRLVESGWQKAVAPPALDTRPKGAPRPASSQTATPTPKEKGSNG